MSKSRNQGGVVQSDATPTLTPMFLWLLGLLFILVAVVFSGLLSLKQLGFIGDSLPGCGPKSACGALTSGPFGRIPGIGWPVSYLGLSWFLGLTVAWLLARRGLQMSIVWLIRLGAVGSLGFVLIMVAKGQICPYCLVVHLGNFAFWIVVENARRQSAPSNAVVGGVAAFLLATLVLAGAQIVQSSNKAIRAAEEEDLLVQKVLDQSNTATKTTAPVDEPQQETTPDTSPGEPIDDVTNDDSDTTSKRDLLASRWLTGDADAPVHVVMISDYQCPDCRSFEKEIQRVLDRRGDVSLSIKHFPMCTDCNKHMKKTLHHNACWAARSAEAAGILGGEEAFWEMHRWLFENRGQFPNGQLPPIVEELGFDPMIFQEIMTSDETLERVKSDVNDGVELGLFFTPMIFVNGVEVKWQLLQTSLTPTVDRIAEAIASGRATADRVTPPVGIEKFVADWRDGRRKQIRPSNREFLRPNVSTDAPHITAFIDFISPNTATFLHKIREWESENGLTNLQLRVTPLNHDCNPGLPERIKDRAGSCMAARALKAAGLIGGNQSAFDMAWWLIDNGPSLGEMDEQTIVDQAASFGIDAGRFQSAMNSAGVDQLIAQDIAEFNRLKFRGIPSILVQNRLIPRMNVEDIYLLGPVLDEVLSKKTN
ncbi:MAG: thioredoxin domain-containing protein [Planctomycetes bacterium]|nr:thioredoxin domain-containing protein [Planctomycetota bacterium]